MLDMGKTNTTRELNFYQSFNLGYYYYSVGTFAYNKLIDNLEYENNVIINFK